MLYLIIGESMEDSVFVNEAFTFSINKYLKCKNKKEGVDYNSFFVVVLRQLFLIYDELDILNPFYFNNKKTLYKNFTKYGYLKEDVEYFFESLQSFYLNNNEKDFLEIQRCLVDMLGKKKISTKLTEKEVNEFKKLLYSPYAENSLIVSYNFLMTRNPFDIYKYFERKMKESVKKVEIKPKETLNLEAYEILKYSLEDIKAMTAEELDDVNKKVYNYFNINENAINKSYLLDKAVYNHEHPKSAFSTGNGYVDILFYLSIVSVVAMIIFILTLIL